MSKIAFIDVEASGLSQDGFPVEVGWAFKDGKGAAYLVRPHQTWDLEAWDPRAEEIHRIPSMALWEEGLDCVSLAMEMSEALGSYLVISDAEAHDARWVDMIFAAAGAHRPFRIIGIEGLMKHMGLSDEEIEMAFARARAAQAPTGRALGDALHLRAVARYAISLRNQRTRGK